MIIVKKENVERIVSSMDEARRLMLDGYELLEEEKEDNFTAENEVMQEEMSQEEVIEIEYGSLEEEKEDNQKGRKRLK